MNAERWQSVKRLLQSALEQPPGERESFLRRECAGDIDLLSEVESLLAANDEAGSFLNSESSPSSEPKLERGKILGSYEIISLIGAGGMGEVYRARDLRIQREVAIKRLPQSLGRDRDRLHRFEREARLAGSLNHPNLVTIHDVGSHEEKPFVVMELLRGDTLRGELGHRPYRIQVRKAVEYAIQIARGLAAAHEQGIVHRDLKPENIFITEDGRLKILDFGLAKAIQPARTDEATMRRDSDGPTTHGVILGTTLYMSPEQVNGESVDVRSDIFSFGIVLYEMLSGRHPFKRDSAIKTMHAIVAEDAPEVSEAQPFLNRVVSRCIEKRPAARFQSARDVGYALEASETSTGDFVASATPQRKRSRAWAAIAAAALVIAIAMVVWIFAKGEPKPISYERLTFRRGMVTQARFAPDGRTVVFGAAWDGDPVRVFVKRPEGGEIVALDVPPADLLSVSRSGDLAILLDPQRQLPWTPIGTLARVSINGGSPRRLADSVVSADWSPDGSSIALIHDTGREQRVEIRSSDGELLRQLFVTSSGFLSNVRFAPSGDRLAFLASPNRSATSRPTVMVVNTDGTGQRSIGSGAVFTDLVWSPDGREIWFADGSHIQTTIRAATMSGRSRIVFHSPGQTSFSDIAGGKILMTQNDITARVSCLARGASAERDASWWVWTLPLEITADGRQVLLSSSRPGPSPIQMVGLKPLDGSPITDLTRGLGYSFAADQRSVLVSPSSKTHPADLAFIPIGTGEKNLLPPTNLEGIAWAAAAPNGKTVILAGVTKNVVRLYLKPIAGGELRPISDEPIYFPFLAVSPDSAWVAAVGPTQRVTVYSITNGQATVIPTSVPGDYPIRFADDGSLLYSRTLRMPNVIYRFDFRTQRQTLVREVAPADRAGVLYAYTKAMTADGQCYCYQYAQVLSKLILADGVDWRAGRFR